MSYSLVFPYHRSLVALACAACLVALPAVAQTAAAGASIPLQLALPAQPLALTLGALARQSGLAIGADAALLAGKTAPALQGRMDLQQALERALAGSGLVAVHSGPAAVSIQRQPEAAGAASLPAVTVTASAEPETPTRPVAGYLARRGATATKTDTPISETPQSISVVTRDRMDDQAVQTSEQALRYTAGVLTEVTGYDLRYQSLNVRGFDAANYRDGLRTFSAGSYSDWLAEPQGLERIEVLKGPASVLYGQAAPGGIVNQIAKRPTADPVKELAVTLGNHNRYQTTLDVGGALGQDDSLLFRVNGLLRDSKTQTDYSQDNRFFLAPSLAWRLSAQTTLTLLADVTRDRVTPKSWWPDGALLEANPNGKIPVSRFVGEPGFDHYNRDMVSAAYLLEHRPNDQWTLRQNFRYSHFKLDYQHVYGDSWQADQRTLNRGTLVSRTHGQASTLDNQAETRFQTGALRHTLLLGLDYQHFSGREYLGFGDAPTLDAFNPVYGADVAQPDTALSHSQLRQTGLYVQDQMRLGAWVWNVGLRHDRAKTRSWDDSYDLPQSDHKTSYSSGVMYLLDNGLSPYASVSTSFTPSVNVGYDGAAFKPETGKQFELGLKYQPPGSNSSYTASLFNLRKQNVTTDDPDHLGYSIQTGEVRSRGLELEATSAVSRQLNLVASYTYLDAKVTQSNDPTELGMQPRQTAKNSASLWLDYRFADAALRGWSVSGGVRYVDKVAADAANSYFNPRYTMVDTALRYKTGPVTVAFNVANLFNKVYVANRAQFYGQGRSLQMTVAYRW